MMLENGVKGFDKDWSRKMKVIFWTVGKTFLIFRLIGFLLVDPLV